MSEPTPDPAPELDLPAPGTPAGPGRAWLPTVARIGALMHTRFPTGLSEETSPSAAVVGELIEQLADTVEVECDPPTPALYPLARSTVALGVAAYIESSAYPEQVDLTSSPAEFYRRRYAEHVSLLRRRIVTDARALPDEDLLLAPVWLPPLSTTAVVEPGL